MSKMEINKKLRSFLESQGQNVSECLLYLLAQKFKLKIKISEESFSFLQKNNMIGLNFLTNEIIPLVGIFEGEEVRLPNVDMSIEQEIRDRVDEYRSMFKGIRSGSIGVKSRVIQLLTQFCLQNGKNMDDVILATKVYMSYTETHLTSNADNFISKLDRDGKEISLLLMAMEEQDMDNGSDARTYKVI